MITCLLQTCMHCSKQRSCFGLQCSTAARRDLPYRDTVIDLLASAIYPRAVFILLHLFFSFYCVLLLAKSVWRYGQIYRLQFFAMPFTLIGWNAENRAEWEIPTLSAFEPYYSNDDMCDIGKKRDVRNLLLAIKRKFLGDFLVLALNSNMWTSIERLSAYHISWYKLWTHTFEGIDTGDMIEIRKLLDCRVTPHNIF